MRSSHRGSVRHNIGGVRHNTASVYQTQNTKNTGLIELTNKIRITSGMNNPVHIEPYHVPYLHHLLCTGKRVLITPKVDGVNSQVLFGDFLLEVEKVSILDTTNYYVIDVLRSKTTKLSRLIRDRLTSFDHTIVKNVVIDTNSVIPPTEFMKNTIDKTLISDKILHDNLHLKTVFDLTLKGDESKFTETSTKIMEYLFDDVVTPYKNDGWIVYVDDRPTPLKIKPLNTLTVDLLYKEGQFCVKEGTDDVVVRTDDIEFPTNNGTVSLTDGVVYRLLPVYSNSRIKWYLQSDRPDKAVQNRTETVRAIIDRVKTNWKASSVLSRYHTLKGGLYYDHDDITTFNNGIKELLEHMRVMKTEAVFNVLTSDDSCVLDIGCGNGNLGRALNQTWTQEKTPDETKSGFIKYYGIDVDPIVLSSVEGGTINGHFFWGDINSILETDKTEQYQPSFNELIGPGVRYNIQNISTTSVVIPTVVITTIITINSVHYVDLNKLHDLAVASLKSRNSSPVDKRKQKLRLIVFGMFAENIDDMIDDLIGSQGNEQLAPNFAIERYDRNCGQGKIAYRFTYPWKNTPFVENIYRKSYFVDTLSSLGWVVKSIERTDNQKPIQRGFIRKFLNLHELVVLELILE
ncbi:S-adenosyl-L-methionine-dependent methyltransferase [Yasminevirus sp. GU-2018]|uniref:S-adenosyl-L-methionine-dependent methyltransferase n=1 Tax=Yasminevirus sp. GU-2018 TaxID=2420051 RepID=A0A5K0U7T7_9VIRU|nr:S-adenosyl-L-methionine-dependent methyltransferase [Yasminevirus sp. GU-2018]